MDTNTVHNVLARLGIAHPRVVGEGDESIVYDRNAETVVKLHKRGEQGILERRRLFYQRLAQYHLPLAFPFIVQVGCHDGLWFTIERKLHGRVLATVLPRLDAAQKRTALRSYLLAIDQLQAVMLADQPFGDLLARAPVQASSWREFLRQKIASALHAAADDLAADVPGLPARLETYFERELASLAPVAAKRLVHGDYWPPNVFVDDRLDVSALADFGSLTVAGDHLMDVAGAVIFAEGCAGVEPADRAFLRQTAVAQHGAGVERAIRFYRLYYSALFSVHKRTNPRAYRWSTANFRRHVPDAAPR